MGFIHQDLIRKKTSHSTTEISNVVAHFFLPLRSQKQTMWVKCENLNKTRDTLAAMWMQRWTQCCYPSLYKSFLHHTPFVSPSHPSSITLWCVCLFLCCSVAGTRGPRDIDWAQLNAVRLMGDMWFTDEILALHSASNHTCTHTNTRTTQQCTHTYTVWAASMQTQVDMH